MARPRTFDPDDALDKALTLFWRKGYHDTSIDDLVAETGVGRKGLYTVFGAKRDLFLRTLDHYLRLLKDRHLTPLEAPGAGLEAILSTHLGMAEFAKSMMLGRGCYMCNSAMELATLDNEVRDIGVSYLGTIKRAYGRALRQAIADGDLPADFDHDGFADLLISAEIGIVVMARADMPGHAIDNVVAHTLAPLRAAAPRPEDRRSREGAV